MAGTFPISNFTKIHFLSLNRCLLFLLHEIQLSGVFKVVRDTYS